jgi:hypothetical protein
MPRNPERRAVDAELVLEGGGDIDLGEHAKALILGRGANRRFRFCQQQVDRGLDCLRYGLLRPTS